MKCSAVLVSLLLASSIHTSCYAVSCNCQDWMERGGYCVDYIKDRIPIFPVPDKDDMPGLKNTSLANVSEGDVAVFAIKNYWHVAYVEKVHRNPDGAAVAIDVTEMNYGDKMSFTEFRTTWKSKSRDEWSRALCCGITDTYDQVTRRTNIPLYTVKQIWSPDDVPSQAAGQRRLDLIVDKVREVINRFFDRAEGKL